MEALEFSAKIENGLIRLPKRYEVYDDAFVRVIVLASKPKTMAVRRKKDLAAVFKRMQSRDIFRKISDPVSWQKKVRNEWD